MAANDRSEPCPALPFTPTAAADARAVGDGRVLRQFDAEETSSVITSLRNYDSDAAIEADLCVLGAGPAGITLASELSGGGLDVCLVESGGLELHPRTQRLSTGEVSGDIFFSLAGTRDRVFGGATHSWAGFCTPLQAIDLAPRPWIPHSGWPISLRDLLPYYERAQPICDLGPYDYDALPADAATRLPTFDGDKLRYILWQHSPPTRFGVKYRSALERAANVRVLLHAHATRIVAEPNHSRVSAVEVSTLEGRTARVCASAVVLAAGGIENARLLLLSGEDAAGGLGNERGLVGRFFMEHVYLRAGVLTPRPGARPFALGESLGVVNGISRTAGIAASPAAQERAGLLNGYLTLTKGVRDRHAGYLALSRLRRALDKTLSADHVRQDLRDVLLDLGDVGRGIYSKLSGGTYEPPCIDREKSTVSVNIEQAPDPENRVTLGSKLDRLGLRQPHLSWRLREPERESARGLLSLLSDELTRLQLGSLQIEEWVEAPSLQWPDLEVKRHHSGTTRMSDAPQRGVVDPDCRVHGIDNLYVAGSSVFPTAGYANPTLTIVALAVRLADHLKASLRSR